MKTTAAQTTALRVGQLAEYRVAGVPAFSGVVKYFTADGWVGLARPHGGGADEVPANLCRPL